MGVEENKGDQVCRQMSEKRKETFGHSLCMRVKSLQSCLTLCDPMDCSLPGSSVDGILQARMLEWVAMPSSRRSS